MILGQPFVRDEKGVTAVEFALVGPIFLALLFGLMQLSIWVLASMSLQHAAEAAARCAAMKSTQCGCTASGGCTVDGIRTFAVAQTTGVSVTASAFSVTGVPTPAKCDPTSTDPQAAVGVGVSASYTPLNFGLNLPTFTANARACYPT